MAFYNERSKNIQVFKEYVIKSMLDNFFKDVKYLYNEGMPRKLYDNALYNEPYDYYYSDDYIKTKTEHNTNMNIAEVHTQVRGNEDYRYRVFHGLFAKIDLNKNINCNLKIISNKRNNNVKKYIEKLDLDSSEFENNFDVFTSENIIGMQLLTADVMELLLEFKNKIKDDFDIFINQNHVYLRIHCGTMFEIHSNDVFSENINDISKLEGFVNKTSLELYYNTLQFIYDLSNILIKIINEVEL